MGLGVRVMALITDYRPPGPIAEQFILDTKHELIGIMGPFGSGKTSACPIKGHYLTQLQVPMLSDGARRSKGYVIRDTYRNLWDKTIPSWKDVFPDCTAYSAVWHYSQAPRPATAEPEWQLNRRRAAVRGSLTAMLAILWLTPPPKSSTRVLGSVLWTAQPYLP